MESPKIRLVVATREQRQDFFTKTAIGRTLRSYRLPFLELDLYENNREGLPAVYNRSIEKAKNSPAILVFTHDDVYLSDFFWPNQLLNGLKNF
jgi:hypothetical protein